MAVTLSALYQLIHEAGGEIKLGYGDIRMPEEPWKYVRSVGTGAYEKWWIVNDPEQYKEARLL